MSRQRWVVLLVALLWLGAMWTYPGWNAFDADSERYDPLRNFLCDLLSAETPDARGNVTSSSMMVVAVVVLVGGCLLPLWWAAPARTSWQVPGRFLGSMAALLTALLCIEQSLSLDLPHGAITLAAGGAGLVPTGIAMVADWRCRSATPRRRGVVLALLLAALLNAGSYALVQMGGTLTPIVPTAQLSAMALLLVWLWLADGATARVPSHDRCSAPRDLAR